MVVREKEDEAEMVTEEGTWVRAVLAQKAMRRTQAMAGDDTHEGEADRLPHGRCIWAHMRYARLGEGDGDGM